MVALQSHHYSSEIFHWQGPKRGIRMWQRFSWGSVLAGRLGSMIGNWILLSVGPVIIYHQTHEGIFIALYYLFQGAPSLLVGPWLGYWVQRFKPKILMMGADISRAIILVGAAALGNPWILLITLFFLTSMGYVFTTGSSLLLSHWAGKRRDALWSLLEVLHNIAVIVGPMTALWLMHVYPQHLRYILFWDAGSFILSAAGISVLWRIRVPEYTERARVSPVRQVVQGIRTLRQQAPQWHAVILVYVMGMVGGYLSVMIIPYMTDKHMVLQDFWPRWHLLLDGGNEWVFCMVLQFLLCCCFLLLLGPPPPFSRSWALWLAWRSLINLSPSSKSRGSMRGKRIEGLLSTVSNLWKMGLSYCGGFSRAFCCELPGSSG